MKVLTTLELVCSVCLFMLFDIGHDDDDDDDL